MFYETFVSFYTMSHDLKICLLPGFVFKGKKKKKKESRKSVLCGDYGRVCTFHATLFVKVNICK